ncbi:MAG: SPFH domain-containing protein [Myxococcota bacterium]|nr:SPFH domain-containing protein [Myxococcota bacterium]MDW8363599.1 SPFH domain-containing protein [Myxococcales bacterium]
MGLAGWVALFFVGLLAVVAIVATVKNLLYVCQPNEVLVFSGLRRRTPDGREVGYRIIRGGRALRVPIFETVARMDLTNMNIDVTVRNAYSKGGIPLVIQGVANVKLPAEEPLIHNALERFLGKSREEITRVARETLEGNLRGVLALLTPEEVNEDKEKFARKLAEEAESDLSTIGLVLDTLNIQNVSDEVGYLNALGRMRSAQIRKTALVAEAEAQAEAAEVKWLTFMRGEIDRIDAQIEVARRDTQRRIADAQTRREALIAEQYAEVQALVAQVQAEIEMQKARIEQVRRQLQADVVEPADAARNRDVAAARAAAASIVEQGRATASVLTEVARALDEADEAARDILLLQKMVPLFSMLASTLGELRVDRMTVIGSAPGAGDNKSSPDLASRLVSLLEQVRAATGIDVVARVRERLEPGSLDRDPGGPALHRTRPAGS